jgi:hypothetical protein
MLYLDSTGLSDAGLEQPINLPRPGLASTKVSDAGLGDLKHCRALEKLTEAYRGEYGVEQLKGLTRLTTLDLTDTNVTPGVAELQKSLPKCNIKTSPRRREAGKTSCAFVCGPTMLVNLSRLRPTRARLLFPNRSRPVLRMENSQPVRCVAGLRLLHQGSVPGAHTGRSRSRDRGETNWRARCGTRTRPPRGSPSQDTRARSPAWHSAQMAAASSREVLTRRARCGTWIRPPRGSPSQDTRACQQRGVQPGRQPHRHGQ